MTIVFISPNSVIPNPIQYYITSTVYRRSTMVFQRSFPPERSCCQNHSWSPNEGFRYSIKLHRGHSKQAQSRHMEHVSSRSLPSRKLFCGSPFQDLTNGLPGRIQLSFRRIYKVQCGRRIALAIRGVTKTDTLHTT
ncbi:C1q-binding protein [Gallid alphaherpesvirus 2]|uniref:C1q-binding protein n=1 Tax=Gallid alphaherpesvirus 2 TaxID=10390 RepID=Q15A31_9ALPH|nr:R-LORF8 [Gallid alphaherpesvirus 2]ABG22700.1 R-LORF8 [Gallid alphaherpesvirus 2]ABG22731.1 R-LORF8 [Gallid alphaherpesvirus 2]ABG22762.1 R-LORF8 [Gallid alphaherpesvirus 2]ABG22793.1 R-LORF8 [Gallid alphaherpesvirus 2]